MKIVAVTSCITGIAHTYMAAEALEQAALQLGHEITVETQGSAGSTPISQATIDAADFCIFANDLDVKHVERFTGKPFIHVGVTETLSDAHGTLTVALAAFDQGSMHKVGEHDVTVPRGTEPVNDRAGKKTGFLKRRRSS